MGRKADRQRYIDRQNERQTVREVDRQTEIKADR